MRCKAVDVERMEEGGKMSKHKHTEQVQCVSRACRVHPDHPCTQVALANNRIATLQAEVERLKKENAQQGIDYILRSVDYMAAKIASQRIQRKLAGIVDAVAEMGIRRQIGYDWSNGGWHDNDLRRAMISAGFHHVQREGFDDKGKSIGPVMKLERITK